MVPHMLTLSTWARIVMLTATTCGGHDAALDEPGRPWEPLETNAPCNPPTDLSPAVDGQPATDIRWASDGSRAGSLGSGAGRGSARHHRRSSMAEAGEIRRVDRDLHADTGLGLHL